MQRTVFITGGTGFIGAYIIKELVTRGYKVKALRRNNYTPFFIDAEVFSTVEWIEGDLFDVVALEEGMQQCDFVIHSAAVVSFHKKDRDLMYRTNIIGTANVVNMCIEAGIKKMVHISSVAALGRTAHGDQVNEEKKWQPSDINTHYAISKYKGEMEVWRGMGEGLQTVILNPSTVIGYGDWNQSSCAIFKNVFNEFPWYTNGINGFVGVEDVARAAVALMESDIASQRFIVNTENWSFRQLFETIAEGLHRNPPTKEATAFLGQIAWRLEKIKSIFTGRKPLLTKETARIAQSITYFENKKILEALPGFSFTPLRETIAKSCKNYLEKPQKA